MFNKIKRAAEPAVESLAPKEEIVLRDEIEFAALEALQDDSLDELDEPMVIPAEEGDTATGHALGGYMMQIIGMAVFLFTGMWAPAAIYYAAGTLMLVVTVQVTKMMPAAFVTAACKDIKLMLEACAAVAKYKIPTSEEEYMAMGKAFNDKVQPIAMYTGKVTDNGKLSRSKRVAMERKAGLLKDLGWETKIFDDKIKEGIALGKHGQSVKKILDAELGKTNIKKIEEQIKAAKSSGDDAGREKAKWMKKGLALKVAMLRDLAAKSSRLYKGVTKTLDRLVNIAENRSTVSA